ncbi:methyltransferase domain-containing protein, partial [bacterium]|nr:methyltransferase domain-containing protein [bacterium]
MNFFSLEGYKKWWGEIVFRHAGRNPSAQNTRASRKFYNTIGWLYDKLYSHGIKDYQEAVRYVVKHYIHEGDRVLDLGCGTGIFLEEAGDKSEWLVGVDLSIGMLKKAQKKASQWSHVDLVNADGRDVPIQAKFDVIFTGFMLVILPRIERFKIMKNMMSILSPHGRAVFLTSRDEFSSEWLTMEEWRIYLQSAGFSEVHVEDIFEYYR